MCYSLVLTKLHSAPLQRPTATTFDVLCIVTLTPLKPGTTVRRCLDSTMSCPYEDGEVNSPLQRRKMRREIHRAKNARWRGVPRFARNDGRW